MYRTKFKKNSVTLLVIMLPAFLFIMRAEMSVAQEIRYEQNVLIRIDSLSSGVILKPGGRSLPGNNSHAGVNTFFNEFEPPLGLLRIKEMLSGCQECVPAIEEKGYKIEEIEAVLRKLLTERGVSIGQKLNIGAEISTELTAVRNIEDINEQAIRTSQYNTSNNSLQIRVQEKPGIRGNTTHRNNEIIPSSTPRTDRESLEETLERVNRDFTESGTFIDQSVQFGFDSYELLPESFQILDAIGIYLLENPGIKMVITGNTCILGSLDYNYQISELRAGSVASYILTNYPEINVNQISTVGHGPDNPIANNEDPKVRYLNRRVEFIIAENE